MAMAVWAEPASRSGVFRSAACILLQVSRMQGEHIQHVMELQGEIAHVCNVGHSSVSCSTHCFM
jgi:hypothetical protein